jgi:hypothetical protein
MKGYTGIIKRMWLALILCQRKQIFKYKLLVKLIAKANKMASTSDIKNGLCIKYNNDIYKIIEFLHVKPGKGLLL